MTYLYSKLFRTKDNSIVAMEYTPGNDYYSFVKSHRDNGYRQVVINSESMISLLKYYFLVKSFSVTDIEFLAENDDLNSEILNILRMIDGDRAHFSTLIDKLSFLIEETSIDIKKICVTNHLDTALFFQVNGILGISKNYYSIGNDEIITLVQGPVE